MSGIRFIIICPDHGARLSSALLLALGPSVTVIKGRAMGRTEQVSDYDRGDNVGTIKVKPPVGVWQTIRDNIGDIEHLHYSERRYCVMESSTCFLPEIDNSHRGGSRGKSGKIKYRRS